MIHCNLSEFILIFWPIFEDFQNQVFFSSNLRVLEIEIKADFEKLKKTVNG